MYVVNAAAEVAGRKHNYEMSFAAAPSLAEVQREAESVFSRVCDGSFAVGAMQVLNGASGRWDDVTTDAQVANRCQLFIFQAGQPEPAIGVPTIQPQNLPSTTEFGFVRVSPPRSHLPDNPAEGGSRREKAAALYRELTRKNALTASMGVGVGEFVGGLRDWGVDLAEATLRDLFGRCDRDADGFLSPEEFAVCGEKYPALVDAAHVGWCGGVRPPVAAGEYACAPPARGWSREQQPLRPATPPAAAAADSHDEQLFSNEPPPVYQSYPAAQVTPADSLHCNAIYPPAGGSRGDSRGHCVVTGAYAPPTCPPRPRPSRYRVPARTAERYPQRLYSPRYPDGQAPGSSPPCFGAYQATTVAYPIESPADWTRQAPPQQYVAETVVTGGGLAGFASSGWSPVPRDAALPRRWEPRPYTEAPPPLPRDRRVCEWKAGVQTAEAARDAACEGLRWAREESARVASEVAGLEQALAEKKEAFGGALGREQEAEGAAAAAEAALLAARDALSNLQLQGDDAPRH
eukprot:gene10871-16727_t